MGRVECDAADRSPSRRRFLAALASVALVPACGVQRGAESRAVAQGSGTHAYGPHPDHVGDLWLPERGAKGATIVLVHGGFWSSGYGRDLMEPLAAHASANGFACWNIEFRRLGQPGGGWPGTFEDVAAAIDHLAVLASAGEPVDVSRTIVVGHSSGGHLALWAAARSGLPSGTPGAGPTVQPVVAVSQAGVADLVGAFRQRVGGSAVAELVGGEPDDVPNRYALTSPLARVPLGVRTRCIHGRFDEIVPLSQSEAFAEHASAAGDDSDLITFDGGHFELLDPEHESWRAALDLIEEVT